MHACNEKCYDMFYMASLVFTTLKYSQPLLEISWSI